MNVNTIFNCVFLTDSLHALSRLPGDVYELDDLEVCLQDVNVLVEAAAFTPLGHDGQVVLRHVAHEQQDVDVSGLPAVPRGERKQSEAGREGEAEGREGGVGGSDSYLRTATSFLNAWNCSGVGSVTFRIFTATSPATDNTPLSHSSPREKCQVTDFGGAARKKKREGASWVHLRGAGPRWERIPTMPFPFVHGPEGAGADAGLQEDLAGLDLPVVAGVPLVPRPLDGWNKQIKR